MANEPMTEQTAIRLADAIERLADTLERGGGDSLHQQVSMAERARLANLIIGGPAAAIAENKRNRLKRPRVKTGQRKPSKEGHK